MTHDLPQFIYLNLPLFTLIYGSVFQQTSLKTVILLKERDPTWASYHLPVPFALLLSPHSSEPSALPRSWNCEEAFSSGHRCWKD